MNGVVGDDLGAAEGAGPPGASLVAGRLQLSVADTRQVAAELWRLDELADRYRALVATARAATRLAAAHPPVGPQAVQALAAATLPMYEAIGDDPGLPADLLPRGWPGPQLSTALGEALRTFGPAVGAHLDHLRPVPTATPSRRDRGQAR